MARIAVPLVLIISVFALTACGDDVPAKPEPAALKVGVAFNGALLKIKNNDAFDWKNCGVKVNYQLMGSDGYQIEIPSIASAGIAFIDPQELATSDGTRFNPFTHKLLNLFIQCDTPAGRSYGGGDLSQ